MALHQGLLLCLGIVLMTAGGVMALCVGLPQHSAWLFGVGLFLGLGGVGLLVSGLCMAKKNLHVAVPGHFLLHPRTGTRFSPRQALAIQRYTCMEELVQITIGAFSQCVVLLKNVCVIVSSQSRGEIPLWEQRDGNENERQPS